MKKMTAVDTDEVLAEHNTALLAFHNQRYGAAHAITDYTTEQWSQIWNVSFEEAERRAVEEFFK